MNTIVNKPRKNIPQDKRHPYFRTLLWFVLSGFMLAGFGVASIVDTTELTVAPPLKWDANASQILMELDDLGLLKSLSQTSLEKLLDHQKKTGQSLAKILGDSMWQKELGLSAQKFKSTWYAANPYVLLPRDLQKAIKDKTIPMTSPQRIYEWCRVKKAPKVWVKALKTALRETTPANLLRASQGHRPFAKNGQLLEPIVIEKGRGQFEVRGGHIATDPRIIATNSKVVMLIRINGKDRLLRVKASDIGGAIRGYHVDLPIQFKDGAEVKQFPNISFPREYIGNPTVTILTTKKLNRGRKA